MAESVPHVNAPDVLWLVVLIVISMLAIVASYHAMQRPRLVLHEQPPGQWRARRRDFWQYVVSMPLLMTVWAIGVQAILLFTNNGLDGKTVVAISLALVIAVRMFAHISREHAHELAKSVPLTIVTLLIITSTGWRTGPEFDRALHELTTTQISGPSVMFLIASEFVIAALWYWIGVRWWYPRGRNVPGLPRISSAATSPVTLDA